MDDGLADRDAGGSGAGPEAPVGLAEPPPVATRTPTAATAPYPYGEDRLNLVGSIPFIAMHVGLVAAPWVGFSWRGAALLIACYYARMFFVTTAYHRYLSHRSFKAGRAYQFFMALMACTSAQKGPLWWAAHHRAHHRYSDTPDDIHSPRQRGFWYSHVGWILSNRYEATDYARIPDFARYPELRLLNRLQLLPFFAFLGALYAAGGLFALFWGGIASTVVLWHGTFTINSLAHVIGRRRFDTGDDSRNHWLLALITMGEGWHNNHHHYQSTANQGFYWWEVDLSYYVLCGLEALGVISDVRRPPAHVLDEGRRLDADRRLGRRAEATRAR